MGPYPAHCHVNRAAGLASRSPPAGDGGARSIARSLAGHVVTCSPPRLRHSGKTHTIVNVAASARSPPGGW